MQAKITAALLSRQVKPNDKAYEVYDTKTLGFFVRVQPSGVMLSMANNIDPLADNNFDPLKVKLKSHNFCFNR